MHSIRVSRRGLVATLSAVAILTVACGGDAADPGAQADAPAGADTPVAAAGAGPNGKYGCSETRARLVNGSWEYEIEQRGFVNISAGRYTDPTNVAGTVRHDAASDSTFFTGAALDGAHATPMDEGRLRIVIPVAGGRENRWTCSRV